MQEVPCKFRLAEALPAGECQPAAGPPVIHSVAVYRFHDISHCGIFTDNAHAAVCKPHLLYAGLLRLRIAAPPASEHTPLQKYNGSDSRSVVHRISLDIKNPSLCFQIISCGRRMIVSSQIPHLLRLSRRRILSDPVRHIRCRISGDNRASQAPGICIKAHGFHLSIRSPVPSGG